MKKLIVILLFTAMIFTMTACSSTVVSDVEVKDEHTEQAMFDRHKLDDFYSILVDKETGVCYLEYRLGSGYKGYYGLTVLLNADGTPKIWED